MNVLVTGAGGQLGKSLQEIIRTDESSHRYIFASHQDLDITDPVQIDSYMKNHEIHAIVNCAAYTQVDQAEKEQEKAELLNATAVAYLAQAARNAGALLIHISTDYVFDGKREEAVPYTESDKTNPCGIYGKTKLSGEEKVIESGCNYLIIRTAWLYSAYGKNFVKTMLKLTSEKSRIKVVSDQYGTPTYAPDLAGFIFNALEKGPLNTEVGKKSCQGIYHFTDEGQCSWYEFAKETARLAGNRDCIINACTTAEYPTVAARPAYSVLSKKKIKDTFGISLPDWKESLEEFIRNGR